MEHEHGELTGAGGVRVEHEHGELTGVGGVRLHRQAWLAPGDARAAVAIAHGAAEHGGRYGHLVDRLAGDGFAIHSLDHRGHGRSEGPRAYVDRFDHALRDFDAFVDLVRARHPGRPLVVLGHSMGGCLAVAYAARHQSKLDALVLTAPLTVFPDTPLPRRLAARTLARIAPRAGVLRVDARGISRDPEEVRRYEQDPLVHRGKLPARTLVEMADAAERFPAELPRIRLPLLVLHGTADRIVPVTAGEWTAEQAGSSDVTLHRYAGFFHELHNEPPGERDRPLGDLAGWLAARA